MKMLAQVFISITAHCLYVHKIGIATEDGNEWVNQYSTNMDVSRLDGLVETLETGGWKKQPSTGYLIIFARYADTSALPEPVSP